MKLNRGTNNIETSPHPPSLIMSSPSCNQAPTLEVKIDALSTRHEEFAGKIEETVNDIKSEIKGAIHELTKELRENFKELQAQSTKQALMEKEMLSQESRVKKLEENLSKQTQDQEVRLVVIEEKSEENKKDLDSLSSNVEKHGQRLAQVVAIAMCASLFFPVAFEVFINSKSTQSEIGYIYDSSKFIS